MESWTSIIPIIGANESRRERKAREEHIVKIDKISATLKSMEPSIDIYKNRINLYNSGGYYCEECTSAGRTPGSCGKTCNLLRPSNRNRLFNPAGEAEWLHRKARAEQKYWQIVSEIKQVGYNASPDVVDKWEKDTEEIHEQDKSILERCHELNVGPFLGRGAQLDLGLNMNWEFESAWGKGPANHDEEIAPDELPPNEVAADAVASEDAA